MVMFIDGAIERGESVQVHSTHGRLRACMCVTQYLTVKYRWTVVKSVEFVQNSQPNFEITMRDLRKLWRVESLLTNFGRGPLSFDFEANFGGKARNEEQLLTNTYLNCQLGDWAGAGEKFYTEIVGSESEMPGREEIMFEDHKIDKYVMREESQHIDDPSEHGVPGLHWEQDQIFPCEKKGFFIGITKSKQRGSRTYILDASDSDLIPIRRKPSVKPKESDFSNPLRVKTSDLYKEIPKLVPIIKPAKQSKHLEQDPEKINFEEFYNENLDIRSYNPQEDKMRQVEVLEVDISGKSKQDLSDPALDSTEVGLKKSDLPLPAKEKTKACKISSGKKRAKEGKTGRGGVEEIFPLERPKKYASFNLCMFSYFAD